MKYLLSLLAVFAFSSQSFAQDGRLLPSKIVVSPSFPSPIEQLILQLKGTTDTDKREKIKAQLKSILEKDYDEKMQQYEEHLQRLENQLAEMRQQLDRRRQAKDDMVKLRIQTIQAEADNLGWPTGNFANGSQSGASDSYRSGSGSGMSSGMKMPAGGYPGMPGSSGGYPGGGSSSGSPGMTGSSGLSGSPEMTNEAYYPGSGSGMISSGEIPREIQYPDYPPMRNGDDSTAIKETLKQILMGMHNYESAYTRLPFQPEGTVDLGWQVKLLPYIDIDAGAAEQFQKFDQTQPWYSRTNRKVAQQRPEAFGGNTNITYCWVESPATKFSQITDGLSNTIAVIAVPERLMPGPIDWIEPGGLNAEQAAEIYQRLSEGKKLMVGFYDGSVSEIAPENVDVDKFKALLTIDGGEVISLEGR